MATEADLSHRIERVKAQLQKLGDLRPGTLSEQYNTCRTPRCRCKAEPPERLLTQLQPPPGEALQRTSVPRMSPQCGQWCATTSSSASLWTTGSTPPSSWTACNAAARRPHDDWRNLT